jgi:septal ring factor EnvC (AmiA/AmiB activator)
MSPEEIKNKIEALQKRYNAAVQEKAGLAGQLQAKKDELALIVQEIRAAGYDPKNLTQERDRVKQELEEMINKLETELTDVETALQAFKKV